VYGESERVGLGGGGGGRHDHDRRAVGVGDGDRGAGSCGERVGGGEEGGVGTGVVVGRRPREGAGRVARARGEHGVVARRQTPEARGDGGDRIAVDVGGVHGERERTAFRDGGVGGVDRRRT